MQLSDVYSASCGLRIQKPKVYDQFFPFIEENFTIDLSAKKVEKFYINTINV